MEWTRGQTIGRGSTATVYLATTNKTGEVVAVKSIELSNSEILKREERIHSTLMCPQIVSYKGSNISCENNEMLLYNLFLEYAPGGTISDQVRGGGGGIDESRIRSYTREILLGIQYLHSNGIVHCDIKGQNILIGKNGGIKIADFGCAKRVAGDVDDRSISGTPIYMAPEVARGEEQSFPSDIWALGCTVIEMVTGKPPWVGGVSDPVSALYRIGFSGDELEVPGFMSKEGKDFVSKCLIKDPRKRWSVSELLQHDFVVDVCNVETPTSVLDHHQIPSFCCWDSVEELEETSQESCSRSASQRIKILSEGNSAEMVDWGCDESWVTVRSNEVISATGEEEEDTIWVGEEGEEHSLQLLDFFNESIKICECTDDVLLSTNFALRNKSLCFFINLDLSLISTLNFVHLLTFSKSCVSLMAHIVIETYNLKADMDDDIIHANDFKIGFVVCKFIGLPILGCLIYSYIKIE